MNYVTSILNKLLNMSGEQVSHEKTIISLSMNVSKRTREHHVQLSRFSEISFQGKYLGVPLTGKEPKRVHYQYIIYQVST